ARQSQHHLGAVYKRRRATVEAITVDAARALSFTIFCVVRLVEHDHVRLVHRQPLVVGRRVPDELGPRPERPGSRRAPLDLLVGPHDATYGRAYDEDLPKPSSLGDFDTKPG